ncbi:unnamed protein product [Alternaria alternata]
MRTGFAFALLFAAKVFALEAPIAGYSVEPFEWEVDTPDGISLINGTLEDVQAETSKYPDFAIRSDNTVATDAELKKRTDFSNARAICGNYPEAPSRQINSRINYLRGLSGRPSNGPGPGACGKVSCAYRSAIWWCNDATSTKTLSSWGSIADGAREIVDRCQHTFEGNFGYSGMYIHS